MQNESAGLSFKEYEEFQGIKASGGVGAVPWAGHTCLQSPDLAEGREAAAEPATRREDSSDPQSKPHSPASCAPHPGPASPPTRLKWGKAEAFVDTPETPAAWRRRGGEKATRPGFRKRVRRGLPGATEPLPHSASRPLCPSLPRNTLALSRACGGLPPPTRRSGALSSSLPTSTSAARAGAPSLHLSCRGPPPLSWPGGCSAGQTSPKELPTRSRPEHRLTTPPRRRDPGSGPGGQAPLGCAAQTLRTSPQGPPAPGGFSVRARLLGTQFRT